ncbi:hypothetical protein N6H14_12250 [Paenibacillus sp. CC-CFT747]|nr:hypothetical protein N6H14_12250 [Paenibacillus sp. CC-CFT747]
METLWVSIGHRWIGEIQPYIGDYNSSLSRGLDLKFITRISRELGRDLFSIEEIELKAKHSLNAPTMHITDAKAPHSPGNIHDYYSNGDYWWPNPDTPMDCRIFEGMDGVIRETFMPTERFCVR